MSFFVHSETVMIARARRAAKRMAKRYAAYFSPYMNAFSVEARRVAKRKRMRSWIVTTNGHGVRVGTLKWGKCMRSIRSRRMIGRNRSCSENEYQGKSARTLRNRGDAG